MNIPRSSSEQDDIVNSLNYEAFCSGLSCSFTTFLTVTDLRKVLSQTK